MKKVMIQYKELIGAMAPRLEKFECGPYAMPFAKEVAKNLEVMGGFDFRFVPVKQ